MYRRAEELLTRAFATIAERGELRAKIEPDIAARLLLSTTLGLQTLWLRDRSINIATELRTYSSVLLTFEL